MKRTLAILLTLMLASGVFASCGGKDNKEETKTPSQTVTDTTGENSENKDEQTEAVDTSAFTTQGIIDSIYAQKSPAFMIGSVPVDFTDKDSYMTYLGIEDISKISEATVSEAMIGSQAYSLVVARVADGQDAKAVAEEMKNGINPRKWVCVGADDVKVTTVGDLICFCMISTEYKEDFTADDAINAFTKVTTGEAQYVETTVDVLPEEDMGEEIPEVDVTDGVIPEDGNTETAPEDNNATSPENSGENKPAEDEQKPVEEPAEQPEEDTPVEQPEEAPVETPEADVPAESISLDGIINKMYEIKMPQFMLGFIPVDMSDEFAYNTYLGINDPSKIVEAVVSEPMIGAQAYSLVVARVAPGQDANAVANEMKAGINPRKWVCVEADDVKVTAVGDLICFCMISTDFAEDFTAQDAMDAFKSVVNA